MSLTTFTVMHDKGERVDGKKLRPYDTFKATMTDELKAKVEKGFLHTNSPAKPKSKARSVRRGK